MNGIAYLLRQRLAVTIRIGLPLVLSILGIFIPAAAQDRYWADRELVPPLRLVEEDFKKGFSRTYQFPPDCWPAISGRDRCEGTISLNYTPGDLASIRAVINFRYVHYCYNCGEDGRDTGPYVHSFNWSDELEPVDDDPEGKFPAVRYNQFAGDIRPIVRSNDPDFTVVPGSATALVDIILMQDIGGTIDRATYARIRFETDTKSWDPDFKKWEFGTWSFDSMYGPPSSESDEEKLLTLKGCSDLLKGGKGQLTAKGKSAGGKYKWSTDSESVLSVSGSASSASVSAKSPGRTVVRVEYETKDGETIEAEKSGSVVELLSVAPVPQIALTDENGNELPPTLVSLVQDPPDGDLLPFTVADPAIATVFNTGSVLQIQGLREGSTTAQAQTNCGEKTGPVIKLEVIRCDKKKIDELTEALKEAEKKLDQNRKLQDETARDPDYVSARNNIDAVKDRILYTAAKTLAGGYDPAGAAFDIGEVIVNAADGKYNEAGMGALGLWAPFLAPVAAYKSWQTFQEYRQYYNDIKKFKEYEKTIDESTKRLESLKGEEQETQSKIQDLSEKLKRCRPGEKPSEPLPTPPSQKPSPKKAQPKQPPSPKPSTEPTAQEEPPAAEPPSQETPPKEPPPPPPSSTGGSVGLVLDCGCDRWNAKTWEASKGGFSSLRMDLSGLMACVEGVSSGPMLDLDSKYQSGLSQIEEIERWKDLPEQELRRRLNGIAPKMKAVGEGLKTAFEGIRAFDQSFRKCDKAIPQAMDTLKTLSPSQGSPLERK